MTRRMFLLSLPFIICACAPKSVPLSKLPPEEAEFRAWLRKRHRWKEFGNKDDAMKAFAEWREEERRKREWKTWKREAGFPS